YLASGSGRSFILSCDHHGAHAYIMRATFDLDPAHLFRNIILCLTHFHMSEEQQQSLKEHSYDVITSPDTVPPGPHNQAWMSRDYAIHPAPEISIFGPPPAGQPAYCEPQRVGYHAQYHVPITASDSATRIYHHTPCAPQSTNQLNNIVPAQPCGIATTTANVPPFRDIPFGGGAENISIPSGGRTKRTRQDFNDADYNSAVPGISMANIYRDLAVRFINNPQSNITMIRMESKAGRSRVMVELEIVDAA
ncbi:hypothetical protein BJV77DRAFT_977728, partial [Russula vinacea]